MKSTSGNVLLYVLIAVVLFGALSFMLTKQMDGNSTTNSLKRGTDRLSSEDLINYATTMRSVVEQMTVIQNVLPTEFSFIKPADVGYNTPPHSAKVYHAAGGGMNLFNAKDAFFAPTSAKRGWIVQQGTNVEWTRTTASDIILTFLDVENSLCQEINTRLYKDSSIPTTTVDSSAMLVNGGGDDADFTLASCPSCNQRVSFCIKDAAGKNAFYNIILAR
jgi:hypothetical protein